jgi:hypothetical protein
VSHPISAERCSDACGCSIRPVWVLLQQKIDDVLERGAVQNRVSADPLAVRLGFVLLRYARPSAPLAPAAATLGVALAALMDELEAGLTAIYGPPVIGGMAPDTLA